MNYLTLAQALRRETTDSGSGPSTVVSQTGELGRFVSWIDLAYQELWQDRDEWLFARKSFTVPTVSGTGEYAYNATGLVDTVSLAAVSRFSRWYRDLFKCYLTSAGVATEYRLIWMEWDVFKRLYRFGTQASGQPTFVSIDPTMKFALGPKPDAIYTVSGDYALGPQVLALDADIPELPTRFHYLIVYEAMIKYAFNRVAPEALQRAQYDGTRLRNALEMDQLPRMTLWEPLA